MRRYSWDPTVVALRTVFSGWKVQAMKAVKAPPLIRPSSIASA